MESVTNTHLLKLPLKVVEDLKKIHNLDKPGRMDEAIDLLEQWLKKQDHILKKDFCECFVIFYFWIKISMFKCKNTQCRLWD